ncbi:vomeronasal type-1 receptor 4-like [Sorex araneus]|uniref:vomeronasal type-1 receptor 4-like n=1 Tax=Sorex araneus TaxID=42254 RepID=UPI000331472E|nr:vomeronasal type-1 receptor 4-like [Sorex araneus]
MSLLAKRNACCPLHGDSEPMDNIPFSDAVVGVIILSQTLLGALGNFSLLFHYLSLYHREERMRATEFILLHLTVSNTLAIASKGVPRMMTALGLKQFSSDLGCGLLLYVQRVGKGMSIGTTCLLSVVQAITISPRDSCWKELKLKAPHYVTDSVSLCWISSMCVNLTFPMYNFYVSRNWSMRNTTKKRDLGYCYTYEDDKVLDSIYSVLIVLPEVLLSVLMVWASGSMIFFLYRHKQRVQHLHRSNVASRPSAESRATHRILVLVSSFVCFHTLSSLFNMCVALFSVEARWCFNTTSIITLCFPTVSPFLVMRRDRTSGHSHITSVK